jgi:hypothetical protein
MKEIPLTHGIVALVDDGDFERLSQWKWHLKESGYAVRRSYPSRKFISMHREVSKPPAELEVDHINGNRLDNQAKNLRNCTRAENSHNTKAHNDNATGFKGVTYLKRRKKWMARICKNYLTTYLGYFETPEAAARAYDEAARKIFGTFANLNYSN